MAASPRSESRKRSESTTGRRHVRDFVISVAGAHSSTNGMMGWALQGPAVEMPIFSPRQFARHAE